MQRLRGLVALVFVLSVVLAPAARAECSGVEAPEPLRFTAPALIDAHRAGGEPSILALRDGHTVIASAHAGTTHLYKPNTPGGSDFVTNYNGSDFVWRSENNGDTWRYVGLNGSETGPYSGPMYGFSDPTLAEDAAGNVYNAGINVANVFVARSADKGSTWSANPVAALFTDREWLAADEADHLYMLASDPGRVIIESRDGGQTWNHGDGLPAGGISSPITVDPNDGTLYQAGDGGDLGKIYVWPNLRRTVSDPSRRDSYYGFVFYGLRHWWGFLNPIAVDDASNVYAVGNDSIGFDEGLREQGRIWLNYSTDHGRHWESVVIHTAEPGHIALWPWISAGSDGRVAVTWLDADTTVVPEPPPATIGQTSGVTGAFRVMSAVSVNAHGSKNDCDEDVPPVFATSTVTEKPIHVGTVCSNGVQCNQDPSASGDRRLGDYFTNSITQDGRLVIAYAETSSDPGAAISHPAFVRQTAGVRLRPAS